MSFCVFDAAAVCFQWLLAGSAVVLYCSFQLMVFTETYRQAINEVMKNVMCLMIVALI